MSYSPGVVDISGQLKAQGRLAQTQGIAQGIEGGFKAYAENKLRNQVLQGDNEGLLKAFLQDPETAKFAPEGIDKYIKKAQEGGGLSLGDNIKMNGMLNSALKTRGVVQQQAAAKQAMAAQAILMQANQAKLEEERRQAAHLNSLINMGGTGAQPVAAPQMPGMGGTDPRGNGQVAPGSIGNAQPMPAVPVNNPYLMQAAQLARATGQAPATHDLIAAQNMATGGTPTSAMRDTEAILQSEIKAGRIKPEALEARRAELLAAGGRDPGERFDNAGVFVDAETGGNARPAVKNRATGQFGFVGPKGEFEVMDAGKWKPSTTGDTNALLDPPGMEKLRGKIIADENSIRGIGRYLKGVSSIEQGAGQLATRVAANLKTLTNKPLTEEEIALGTQKGRLQQIIGGLRTSIVGPGVMTEQDAERIVAALGGDVTMLQNQEVVKRLIADILTDKINEYDSDLGIYNTHVVRKYGGQAGYKQRERIPVEFGAQTKADAPNPAKSILEKYGIK